MLIKTIDRLFYPEYTDNWDDIIFREKISSFLRPEYTILDLGAGSGLVDQMNFRGRCRAVYGLDLEESVLSNPHLDHALLGSAETIPAEPESFDLIFGDNLLEHLHDPLQVFLEVQRTLKPGGVFLIKTPNRFHYVSAISRLTPTGIHRFVNKLRGRREEDTFPTRYRANSRRRLLSLAGTAGLEVLQIEQIEGRPEYMRLSPLLYPIGIAWERLVNLTPLLGGLRVILVGAFRK